MARRLTGDVSGGNLHTSAKIYDASYIGHDFVSNDKLVMGKVVANGVGE